jgi:hypothetical protein
MDTACDKSLHFWQAGAAFNRFWEIFKAVVKK